MRTTLMVIFPSVLAAVLPAQQTKIVPSAAATADGNTLSVYPFGYTTGRSQHIIDGAALVKTTALIKDLSLRADSNTNDPGRRIQSLTVTIGYTSATPTNLSRTFASNRLSTQTVVFSGTYNLPPQTPQTNQPFNITWKLAQTFQYLRRKGNLLLEFVIPGTPGKSNYFVDAHRQTRPGGGTVTDFGTRGPFKSGDLYKFTCPDPASLKPGGQARLSVSGLKSNYPSFAAYGISNKVFGGLTLPFDLTPLGAPNNKLYVSLDLQFPLGLARVGQTWAGTFVLPIPNLASLNGIHLYGQGLFIDPPSNGLKLVLSNGVDMLIRAGGFESNMLGHYNSTSATGNTNTTTPTGIVIQFGGVFI